MSAPVAPTLPVERRCDTSGGSACGSAGWVPAVVSLPRGVGKPYRFAASVPGPQALTKLAATVGSTRIANCVGQRHDVRRKARVQTAGASF